MSQGNRNTGRGVLLTIAVFLAGSALIRVGTGGGFAFANTLLDTDEIASPRPIAEPDVTPELLSLLENLRTREADLSERTVAFEARMQVLRRAETEVADGLARLEAAETALRATMAAANSAAEADIARLTSVYENMDTEQAATLFGRMEPTFAAGFLGRMRADAAASIMSGLDPELAYSISVVMAGRNADIPVDPPAE